MTKTFCLAFTEIITLAAVKRAKKNRKARMAILEDSNEPAILNRKEDEENNGKDGDFEDEKGQNKGEEVINIARRTSDGQMTKLQELAERIRLNMDVEATDEPVGNRTVQNIYENISLFVEKAVKEKAEKVKRRRFQVYPKQSDAERAERNRLCVDGAAQNFEEAKKAKSAQQKSGRAAQEGVQAQVQRESCANQAF